MIKINGLIALLFATSLANAVVYASDTLDYTGRALLHLNHVYAYKNNGVRYPEKREACRHYFQKVYGTDQLDELVSYDINLSSMVMRANAVVHYMNYRLEPMGTWPTIDFLNQIKAPNAPAVYFGITINSKNKMVSGRLSSYTGAYQCSLSA